MLPADADPLTIAIRNKMLKEEAQAPFVKDFVKTAGFPLWNKVIKNKFGKPNVSARTPDGDIDDVLYVPFAKEGDSTTSAIVIALIKGEDTTLRTIYHYHYKSLPNEEDENDVDFTAEKAALLFMVFDRMIYGYSLFYITDPYLFADATPNQESRFVKLTGDMSISRTVYSVCYEVKDPGDCTPSSSPTQNTECGPGGMARMSCFNVYLDDDPWWDAGGGGIGGPDNPPGGGGGGGPWNQNPCRAIEGSDPCNNPTGWVPVLSEEVLPSYVIEDLTKPCLIKVLHKLSGGSQNTFFKQIYNVFDTSTNIYLLFTEANLTSDTAYGITTAPIYTTAGVSYGIQMDTTALLNCSQEWIAYVYIHEIAHAGMFANIISWDTTNTQHIAMAGVYLNKMASALKTAYSTLSEFNAYAICFAGFFNGIEGTASPADIAFSQVIAKIISQKFGVSYTNSQLAAFGRQYTEAGTKGTRNDCN